MEIKLPKREAKIAKIIQRIIAEHERKSHVRDFAVEKKEKKKNRCVARMRKRIEHLERKWNKFEERES